MADRARRAADSCGLCGRDLEPAEPVVWANLATGTGPACRECTVADPENVLNVVAGGWRLRADLYPWYLCDGCERPVFAAPESRRRYVTCSTRCARRAWRTGGARATPTTCEVCDEEFMPSRSDAQYCSGTCRQRAYRRRGAKAQVAAGH